MNLRKTLAAVSLAGFMASCSPSTVPVRYKPELEPISYDNSGDHLKDKELKTILPNIREIEHDIIYAFEDCSEKVYFISGISSSVMVKRDEHYDYYLTANHAVAAAPEMELFFSTREGAEYCHGVLKSNEIIFVDNGGKLEVLLADPELDFAYSRSSRDDSIPFGNIELGDSSILSEADFVYAIGYTLGMDRFVTGGNVSALRRAISPGSYDTNLFMFTAPITFGNSGGPVFSLYHGKPYLVGIAVIKIPTADNMYGAVKINKILESMKRTPAR